MICFTTACLEGTENVPARTTDQTTVNTIFEDNHPTFRQWKNHYLAKKPQQNDLVFKKVSTESFQFMAGSVKATFDKNFDTIYKPFLVFSPDKTRYIDLDSYQWQLIEGELQFEADQEVNLVDTRKKTVQRLAFRGPSAQIEEVYWKNNHTVVLLENFDAQLYVHVIDLQKHAETTFVGNKKCSLRSNYSAKRIQRLLTKNNPTNSNIPGNQNCFCEQDTEPLDIRCEPIIFDNNAQLRWHYDCDSVWLTFEKPGARKQTLFTLSEEMREYAGDLGYVYFIEYKTTFLAENKPISGCCAPMNYDLFTNRPES